MTGGPQHISVRIGRLTVPSDLRGSISRTTFGDELRAAILSRLTLGAKADGPFTIADQIAAAVMQQVSARAGQASLENWYPSVRERAR